MSSSLITEKSVRDISQLPEFVNRNLRITAFYRELSDIFSKRTGTVANWCTFATWASKQAGVTIRGEDLQRKLENTLTNDGDIQQLLSEMMRHAKKLGTVSSLHSSAIKKLVESVQQKASSAVARGNKKVFEEIALHFARFIATCVRDERYTDASINEFCEGLSDGDPPNGQQHLKKAFTLYYRAFFETDSKVQDELIFLANVLIGFHEQTRLQPEILESLNAAAIDRIKVKDYLTDVIVNSKNFTGKIIYFFTWLIGGTALFKKAVDALTSKAEQLLRKVITKHLMTLTLPPNVIIELSEDLVHPYPQNLGTLINAEVIELLEKLRPTPETKDGAGCKDWSVLRERIHFIANLFRCHHRTADLFGEAFTAEELRVIQSGRIPEGRL